MKNNNQYRRGFLKVALSALSSAAIINEANARSNRKNSIIGDHPADFGSNIYSSLAALKAADANQLSYTLIGTSNNGTFKYETAGAPYTGDDINVIALNNTSPAVGALIRQEQLPDIVAVESFRTLADASDSATIQRAVNAARGKILVFSTREYILDSTITFSGILPIHIIGNGATIKGGASRLPGGYFDVSNSQGLTFDGLRFDMLQNKLPIYNNSDYGILHNTAIKANTGWSNLTILNCEFINLYSNAVFCYRGSAISVTNCTFRSRVQNQRLDGQAGAQDLSHIFMLTVGGLKIISNNRFLNEAITNPANGVNSVYMSGMLGETYIQNNYSVYAGRDNSGTHRLADYDIYGDAVNVHIDNNVSEHLMGQFMRMSSAKASSIKNNIVTVDQNGEFDATTISLEGVSNFGGKKGIDDIEISGNTFTDSYFRHAATIAIIGYDYAFPALNVSVLNNLFIGGRQNFALSGPFRDVRYENNNSRLGKSNVFVKDSRRLIGEEAHGVYDGLYINHNVASNEGPSSGGITIAFGNPTKSYIGYTEVIGNNIVSSSASIGQGIAILMLSSDKSNSYCRVESNFVANYDYNYCIRDGGHFIVENNISRNAGTAPYFDGAGQLSVSLDRNRWGSGKLTGIAVLVGGTATIATDEIRAGDLVQISRLSNGSSPGHLRLGLVNSEISFVIDSSDANDNGEVLWRIVH